MARNVSPFTVEPGKFTYRLVRGELEFAEYGQIIAHCRGKIAGYKIPKRVEFRDELARTATGKIQKFKLREEYWKGQERRIN